MSWMSPGLLGSTCCFHQTRAVALAFLQFPETVDLQYMQPRFNLIFWDWLPKLANVTVFTWCNAFFMLQEKGEGIPFRPWDLDSKSFNQGSGTVAEIFLVALSCWTCAIEDYRFAEFFAGEANVSWCLKHHGFRGLSFDSTYGGRYNNIFEPCGFAHLVCKQKRYTCVLCPDHTLLYSEHM